MGIDEIMFNFFPIPIFINRLLPVKLRIDTITENSNRLSDEEQKLYWLRYGKKENEIPKMCRFHSFDHYGYCYHRLSDTSACTYYGKCKKCGVAEKVEYHGVKKDPHMEYMRQMGVFDHN